MTDPPAPVLSAAEIAAIAGPHREQQQEFIDLTGQRQYLPEGCCACCGDRWPCTVARLAASHTAVVGENARLTDRLCHAQEALGRMTKRSLQAETAHAAVVGERDRLANELATIRRLAQERLAEVGDAPDYQTAFRHAELLAAALSSVERWADSVLDGREPDGCPRGKHLCGAVDPLDAARAREAALAQAQAEVRRLRAVLERIAVASWRDGPMCEVLIPSHFWDAIRREYGLAARQALGRGTGAADG